MDPDQLLKDFADLPPEAQRSVADYMAFLRIRYLLTQPQSEHRETLLADDPFIGLWRDRSEMADSHAWVRSLREREWMKSN